MCFSQNLFSNTALTFSTDSFVVGIIGQPEYIKILIDFVRSC